MTAQCTFARASPVSLSRKPFSLDIEATPKTDLSLSVSLVHRQTWRLTGFINQCTVLDKGIRRLVNDAADVRDLKIST